MEKTITVDGIEYIPKTTIPGARNIVVLDRGWIFVGDLQRRDDGTCSLINAKNIRKWGSGGFGGMTQDPKSSGVETDDCADLDFTVSAVLFIVPVRDSWNE